MCQKPSKTIRRRKVWQRGLDDWQLKSKIDEQLAFTNYFSQNVVLTLEYSQKFLRDARMLNDSSMVVRAHQTVAGSYELLDVTDSAFVYLLREG